MKNDLTNKVKNNPAYKIYELMNQLAILKEYLKYLSKNSLNSQKAIKNGEIPEIEIEIVEISKTPDKV